MQIVECVPNISEGKDQNKIQSICDEVRKVDGVKLINIDPGKSTNRTVITFIGDKESVIEAAFMLIKKAQELMKLLKECVNLRPISQVRTILKVSINW